MKKKNYLFKKNQLILSKGASIYISSLKKYKILENNFDNISKKYINSLENINIDNITKETYLNKFFKKFK